MRKPFSTKPETKLAKFREVNEDELQQTEGGGWLQDAYEWFRHDAAGVPRPEDDYDRVAAGTRA